MLIFQSGRLTVVRQLNTSLFYVTKISISISFFYLFFFENSLAWHHNFFNFRYYLYYLSFGYFQFPKSIFFIRINDFKSLCSRFKANG